MYGLDLGEEKDNLQKFTQNWMVNQNKNIAENLAEQKQGSYVSNSIQFLCDQTGDYLVTFGAIEAARGFIARMLMMGGYSISSIHPGYFIAALCASSLAKQSSK